MSIKSEFKDGVRTIAFARAEKKNAITAQMYSQMAELLREADGNDQVKAVLFTGIGDCFTAGNDMNDFMNTPPTSMDSPVFHFLRAISSARKPLLAAVPGLAIGIGTTMLLHCDLVYASEDAKFKMPFVDLGLVPEAASSLLLPQLMGHVRAAELLLLGEAIDAQRAMQLGIVNQVLPAGELLKFARAKAAALAAKPGAAVMASKALMKRPAEAVWARMEVEAAQFSAALQSPEARAIFAAFLSKK
jgi:enoyl-CoA hydratase/carnithine racemase